MLLPRLERLKGTWTPRNEVIASRGLFFVAHNVSNVLNYAFLLAMSQVLSSSAFALFAALFGAVYLASALANTAQTSIAAATAGLDTRKGEAVVADAARRLLLATLPFVVVVVVAARPVAVFLHSDDLTSIGLTGAAIWLTLFAAVGYGALQGTGRFGLLSVGLTVASAGRLLIGGALVWHGMGVQGALLGIVLGMACSAALVLAPFAPALRRKSDLSSTVRMPMLAALLTSVAIATPTSADVLLARHFFSADQAATYAAVSVLGKISIFAPMAVALILFPEFVRRAAGGEAARPLLRIGLLSTAAVALPLSIVVLAAGTLAPGVVLRGHHASALFFVTYLGAMLAFSFVVTLLYCSMAQRNQRFIIGDCVTLALELAAVLLWHSSAFEIAAVLLAGNTLLLAGGLWLSVIPLPRHRDSGRHPGTVTFALPYREGERLASPLPAQRTEHADADVVVSDCELLDDELPTGVREARSVAGRDIGSFDAVARDSHQLPLAAAVQHINLFHAGARRGTAIDCPTGHAEGKEERFLCGHFD